MFDRRLVTDVGLALLLAFPAILPAAPTPWSADDKAAKPSVAAEQAKPQAAFAEAAPADHGRS